MPSGFGQRAPGSSMEDRAPSAEIIAVPASLSPDCVYQAVAKPLRRRLLLDLLDLDKPTDVKAISKTIGEAIGERGDEGVEPIHLRLYHVDIPLLAELGFVAWDHDTKIVHLTEDGRRLAATLDGERA